MICPFTSLKPPKKTKFWKNEKNCWRHHFTHVHQKSQSFKVQFLTYKVTDIVFCHFGPFFANLPVLQTGKSKFWKMKNAPIDVIILHISIKNYDHMMYASWDWYGVQQTELFVTLSHFLPFYSLRTRKIKILKKRKNTWRYYQFTHVYHK